MRGTARSVGVGAVLLACACADESFPVYGEDELSYFAEIAFGSEYGDPADTLTVRRFERDVRIRIEGFPTSRQEATVRDVANELDDLVAGISVETLARGSDAGSNARILFVTHDSMVALAGHEAAASSFAWFTYWRGDDDAIDSARAIIAYDRGSQDQLDHHIREELTQMLGLGRDSYTYEESVFYQGSSYPLEFAPIDRSVIRMLYDRRIESSMSREEALRTLRGD